MSIKKGTLIGIWALVISMVIVIAIGIAGIRAVIVETNKAKQEQQVKIDSEQYELRWIPGDVIRVIGIQARRRIKSKDHPTRLHYGYGSVFEKALSEISDNYIIKQITAINYFVGNSPGYSGAITKELLVIVSPKKKEG